MLPASVETSGEGIGAMISSTIPPTITKMGKGTDCAVCSSQRMTLSNISDRCYRHPACRPTSPRIFPTVRLAAPREIRHVYGIAQKHDDAVQTLNNMILPLLPEEHALVYEAGMHREEQEHRGGHGDKKIHIHSGLERKRRDDGTDPQNPENVKDIAPDDVAHGDIRSAFASGHHGGSQFRQRRSDGNDRDSDQSLRDTERLSDGHRAIDCQLASAYKQREADEHEAARCPGTPHTNALIGTRRIVPSHTGGVPKEDQEECNEGTAV